MQHTEDKQQQQPGRKGLGMRVQRALGRLGWSTGGGGDGSNTTTNGSSSSRRQAAPASTGQQQQQQRASSRADMELTAVSKASLQSSSTSTAGGPLDAAAGGSSSAPRAISHISSAGSLQGGALNDASSVASGSSQQHFRHSLAPAATGGGASAAGDEGPASSMATQVGSAAHSFTSLQSMLATHSEREDGGGGSLLSGAGSGDGGGGATDRLLAPVSPTQTGTPSNMSLLSAYRGGSSDVFRGSDAGGDATSVSTLPLISEAGLDEGDGGGELDVDTLTEEEEADLLECQRGVGAGGRRRRGEEEDDDDDDEDGSSRGGGGGSGSFPHLHHGGRGSSAGGGPPRAPSSSEGGSDAYSGSVPLASHGRQHTAGTIGSGHGSFTSLTSNASDLSGPSHASGSTRGPAPHLRTTGPHGSSQRSGSRHSFQQGLLQELEEDAEQAGSPGTAAAGVMGGSGSVPVPLAGRRRHEGDDMASCATQAGSSVHSISSLTSYVETLQRQQLPSNDGSVASAAGSRGRLVQPAGSHPLQPPQQLPSPQRHHSSGKGGRGKQQQLRHGGGAAGSGRKQQAAGIPGAGSSSSAGGASTSGAGPAGLTGAGNDGASSAGSWAHDGGGDSAGGSGLQRKGSLKGAFKAVTRWGSGIGARLQRTSSGTPQRQGSGGQQLADFSAAAP